MARAAFAGRLRVSYPMSHSTFCIRQVRLQATSPRQQQLDDPGIRKRDAASVSPWRDWALLGGGVEFSVTTLSRSGRGIRLGRAGEGCHQPPKVIRSTSSSPPSSPGRPDGRMTAGDGAQGLRGEARLREPAREGVRYDCQPYSQAVSRPASPFLTRCEPFWIAISPVNPGHSGVPAKNGIDLEDPTLPDSPAGPRPDARLRTPRGLGLRRGALAQAPTPAETRRVEGGDGVTGGERGASPRHRPGPAPRTRRGARQNRVPGRRGETGARRRGDTAVRHRGTQGRA